MTFLENTLHGLPTIVVILGVLGIVALIETVIPLHGRGQWGRAHLGPNLALTFITISTNLFFNTSMVMVLQWCASADFGILHHLGLPRLITIVIAVLLLDFSFYVAHVTMHKIPVLWRFHSVHHSDPEVDVTTTIRQHPGESIVRYVFMAAAAISVGASPGAFAIYRVWSAINGLFEHANIRLPNWIDDLLSLVIVTPNMHKVHHSRTAAETDTNYGNVVSLFDRFFCTFTRTRRGLEVQCGLDGFDHPDKQSTTALLAMPFIYDGGEDASLRQNSQGGKRESAKHGAWRSDHLNEII